MPLSYLIKLIFEMLALNKRFMYLLTIDCLYGPVPSKDMQSPPPLRNNPIIMQDTQCAEMNEKSIF